MKKNIYYAIILCIATMFFVMELTRNSKQDCSIGGKQVIERTTHN